jgi:hypothetical protein
MERKAAMEDEVVENWNKKVKEKIFDCHHKHHKNKE